jgi:hypothetical protein
MIGPCLFVVCGGDRVAVTGGDTPQTRPTPDFDTGGQKMPKLGALSKSSDQRVCVGDEARIDASLHTTRSGAI